MGINRSIDALRPELAAAVRRFLGRCEREQFGVLIIETDRSQAVQSAYYAQGRRPLEEVNQMRRAAGLYLLKERENTAITNAAISNHTGGNAVDMCPEIAGKPGYPWWNAPSWVWEKMGLLAEECGLDWCAGGFGQTWGKGWDNPHFELMETARGEGG
jgi:peptidoglycan L-alanyl-D-glutamate endopeptidase CwlK